MKFHGGFPGGLLLSQSEDNRPLDALSLLLCRADFGYESFISWLPSFFTLFPHIWNQVLAFCFLLLNNGAKII